MLLETLPFVKEELKGIFETLINFQNLLVAFRKKRCSSSKT